MMYSEFVRGTGCKQNAHNFKVFQDLEVMYMYSDLTKEQIYEYGKKLVDNSPSAEMVEWTKTVEQRIADAEEAVQWCEGEVALFEGFAEDDDPDGYWAASAKFSREILAQHKAELKRLKGLLKEAA